MNLTRAVGCDDHERRLPGLDGADLGDRDLEVREQLEQEGLELLVGAIDLVDEQHRRDEVLVVDGVEQRPPEKKLGAEDLALRQVAVGGLVQQADVQQLARVVPLVHSVREVDALVALEPNQPRPQHVRHDLGRLGLADARLALDEERLLQLQAEEDGRGQRAIADVASLAQPSFDLVDRSDARRRGGTHAPRVPPVLTRLGITS